MCAKICGCTKVVLWAFLITAAIIGCAGESPYNADDPIFYNARANGVLAREGFERCHRFVEGWLAHADPETGLIPRNLDRDMDIWNAKDSAADNYPFMVLTSALTDHELYIGLMRDMLETERRLTSRVGSLPDTYSFSKVGFASDEVDMDAILFGSSEYIKDGLLPLTEWLGESPWSKRMIEILDDMWANAPVTTPYGDIVSESHEVNGEMLQTLSRVYWMTGDEKYLEWAVRLGDYYLLGENHPTRDTDRLRLRDHGCEIVSGLCELYATVHFTRPEKRDDYKKSLHEMLDRILEVGRNEHGLFYNVINPRTGEVTDDRGTMADTFGYTLNGYYTVYLLDGTAAYREAVLLTLFNLDEHYRSYDWERGSSDGYADAIESGLNLYNRERIDSVAAWLDSEIKVMWAKQQTDGVIEGWHGDGNFARTTIMYCLWKTQGVTIDPWRSDITIGSVEHDGRLWVSIRADEAWKGHVRFDTPRHKTVMHLPLDWPRINQFPEWYTVTDDVQFTVHDITAGSADRVNGLQLIEGLELSIPASGEQLLVVDR